MSVLTLPPTPSSRPAPSRPTPKRYTVAEFHEMWEAGWFEHCKPMLIDGEVFEMAKPGPLHNASAGLADYILKAIFTSGYWVRVQMPLELGQSSDPEPDLSVVRGGPRNYPTNPTTAELVVEVSDTSLDMDTGPKAQLYAAAGIADYWVIDLNNSQLIVHRDPRPDAGNAFGASYATVTTLKKGQSVSPLAAPAAGVNVTDLLP
jgi:Uma2 family endonuclease